MINKKGSNTGVTKKDFWHDRRIKCHHDNKNEANIAANELSGYIIFGCCLSLSLSFFADSFKSIEIKSRTRRWQGTGASGIGADVHFFLMPLLAPQVVSC